MLQEFLSRHVSVCTSFSYFKWVFHSMSTMFRYVTYLSGTPSLKVLSSFYSSSYCLLCIGSITKLLAFFLFIFSVHISVTCILFLCVTLNFICLLLIWQWAFLSFICISSILSLFILYDQIILSLLIMTKFVAMIFIHYHESVVNAVHHKLEFLQTFSKPVASLITKGWQSYLFLRRKL